jgi:hypothetical protein
MLKTLAIIGSTPASKVGVQLDFIKPFEAHNIAEFVLVPQDDATSLSWTMHGPTPWLSKLMQVFVSRGKDFEAGLANLKVLVEK